MTETIIGVAIALAITFAYVLGRYNGMRDGIDKGIEEGIRAASEYYAAEFEEKSVYKEAQKDIDPDCAWR